MQGRLFAPLILAASPVFLLLYVRWKEKWLEREERVRKEERVRWKEKENWFQCLHEVW